MLMYKNIFLIILFFQDTKFKTTYFEVDLENNREERKEKKKRRSKNKTVRKI